MAVDYVKTGEPAVMPRELDARNWPHFMEKRHKPKDQIYTSRKVLGRLYDQVERVDFVPAFNAPFDKRILDAYDLNEDILQKARDLKIEYDAAMHRIMAQHEIRNEFEVWSTFVLHHAGDSKDYKFHEVIGELSNSLKYQFRDACYQKAGGKEFEHIGPFVVAMYQITYDEMAQAIRECNQVRFVGGQEERVRKMEPASMPLMSFPWLFHGILGKIANGATDLWPGRQISTNQPWQRELKRTLLKKGRTDPESSDEEDVVQTAEGITHRGEVLELFEDLIDYEHDEPVVAPKMDSDPTYSGPTSGAANISVDDLLFDDSTRGFVMKSNVARNEGSSEVSSDSLMDAPLEGTLGENAETGSIAYTCGISPGSSHSRSNLPDNRWKLVEEFAQSAKKRKEQDVPEKANQQSQNFPGAETPMNSESLRSEASLHNVPLSAGNGGSLNIVTRYKNRPKDSVGENDRSSHISNEHELEVKAAEEESRGLFEIESKEVEEAVGENESDSGESESESEEETVHIDIDSSLIDSLIKLNED